MKLPIILLLVATTADAASWYAATNGVPTNTGTIGSPWDLRSALTNASIAAGDTLHLRGGTYDGGWPSTLTGTAENYITVRSYVGEWAVIRESLNGVLAVAANTTTNRLTITGSTNWASADVVIIDAETIQLSSQPVSGTWVVNRGWGGSTPAAHSENAPVIRDAKNINHTGSYVTFRDFELTNLRATNRIVGTSNALGGGLDLITGVGNKAINLIFHNCGHPALGFWQQGAGAEVNGCLFWGNGMYDTDGTWIRGNGIYAQNESGLAKVKDCILFRNFTIGSKVYGEAGPVKDYQHIGNFAFANGSYFQLEASSGSTSTSNTWFLRNKILGGMMLAYASTNNSRQYVGGNVIVDGSLFTSEQFTSAYTNNTILLMTNVVVSELTTAENGYVSTNLPTASLDIEWDRNIWYIGNDSSHNAWRFRTTDTNSGWQYWSGWQGASSFDANSTVATNWPTDYLNVTVQPLDYDTNRWHICVISTSGGTNTTITLSDYGITAGQRYTLRDAQNYFVPITTEAQYAGGTINLPLNLTNVADIPGVTNFVNKHTNVDQPGLFNAFVLTRSQAARSLHAVNARVGRIIPP